MEKLIFRLLHRQASYVYVALYYVNAGEHCDVIMKILQSRCSEVCDNWNRRIR